MLVLSAANVQAYYGTTTKPQARDVMSYIDGNARSGDLVFVYSGGANAMIFIWYNNKTDLTNKGFPAKYIDLWSKSTEQNINELNSDVAGHDRVWIASTQQHEYIFDLVKASMQKL